MQAETKQRLLILLIISVYIFFFLPILLVNDINDPEYISNDLRHNIHQFRAVFDDPLNFNKALPVPGDDSFGVGEIYKGYTFAKYHFFLALLTKIFILAGFSYTPALQLSFFLYNGFFTFIALLFCFLILKSLFNKEYAFIGLLIFAFHSQSLRFFTRFLPDVAVLSFTLISIYGFLIYLTNSENKKHYKYLILGSLGIGFKVSAFIPFYLILFFIFILKDYKDAFYIFFISIFLNFEVFFTTEGWARILQPVNASEWFDRSGEFANKDDLSNQWLSINFENLLGIESQSNALGLSIRGLFISNYRSYEIINNLIFVITFSLFVISIYYFAKNVNKFPVRFKIFYFYIFLVSILSLFGSYMNTRDLYAGSPIKYRWIMWVIFFISLIYVNFLSIVNFNNYFINGFLIFYIAMHTYEAHTAVINQGIYSFYSDISTYIEILRDKYFLVLVVFVIITGASIISSYIDVFRDKYFLVLLKFIGLMIFVSGRILYLLNL